MIGPPGLVLFGKDLICTGCNYTLAPTFPVSRGILQWTHMKTDGKCVNEGKVFWVELPRPVILRVAG